MQVVSPDLVKGKKVLLRFDIDVPIQNGKVVDDFRLKAGLPTLKLCLENAEQVIIMGHIGRPGGREVLELSVEPIHDWLVENDLRSHLSSGKLKLLENLRFEVGEEGCDLEYANKILKLAASGEPRFQRVQNDDDNLFYVNEAFAAHHPSASTTVLPTLLPHAVGLRFAEEVQKLTEVRENPERPLVVIIGGVKIEDKGPAIEAMSKIADTVLVGGKLASELGQKYHDRDTNVLAGSLTEDGMDISQKTVEEWEPIIRGAKMIVWNGPLGKVEEEKYSKGTEEIARAIIDSGAQSLIGGGDTIKVLNRLGILEKFSFVSVGGGAMLKFLTEGTLATIKALD